MTPWIALAREIQYQRWQFLKIIASENNLEFTEFFLQEAFVCVALQRHLPCISNPGNQMKFTS